jgi:hypothetical protein
MKNLPISLLLLLLSSQAFAVENCFKYMTNIDRVKVLMKKECSLILKDSGKKKVASIDLCFTKMTDQFNKGEISFSLFAEIQNQSGYVTQNVFVVNTTDAIETDKAVTIERITAAPELMTRSRHRIKYNKDTESLEITQDTGLFRLKNQYDLKLQCK